MEINPLAVTMEAMALNEFYKNRCLVLADEIHRQRQEIERLRAQVKPKDSK